MNRIMYKGKVLTFGLIATCAFLLSSCSEGTKTAGPKTQPNILWLYVEDINPWLSCYGKEINPTPHIDRLAENGVLFEKAFSPTPVCSPTRSGIIVGCMPSSINAHHHHSSRTVESANFLPEGMKTVPELFREAGYYTFNNGKDDYNFIYDRKKLYSGDIGLQFWYTFDGTGHWRDAERGDKPFFAQFQYEGGKTVLPQPKRIKLYDSIVPPQNRIDTSLVNGPPFYPDVPTIRFDIGEHYNSIRYTDSEIGHIMGQLEDDGLLENTIVFFFSDHGYKGTRHKQFCYDGGLHVPLIVAYFGDDEYIKEAVKTKTRRGDLVNLIDVGPTSLALAGLEVPSYMEGKNLFADDFKRDFVIGTRDRCDFTIDRIRTVRSEKFRYIKNYDPNKSFAASSYRDTRPEYIVQKAMYEAGQLNEIQAFYWGPTKPEEELYDIVNDPHEINNLANDPAYADELQKHRNILENWIAETGDYGQYKETESLEGIENLRFIINRWGPRAQGPEYDLVRSIGIPGSPLFNIQTGGLKDVDDYGDDDK